MRYSPHRGPTSKVGAIGKGAAIGFLVGIASIAAPDKGVNHILFVLSKPVEWIAWLAQKIFRWADGSTAMFAWLGLGIYWMIIGGLVGWGVSVVSSRMNGDE